MNQNKKKFKEGIIFLLYIMGGCLLGFLISNFLLQRVTVYGHSMDPTFYTGQTLALNCTPKWLPIDPTYDDIVVLKNTETEEKDWIKRVIGCPGDSIEITDDGHVIRNGEILNEAYILEPQINPPNLGNYRNVILQDQEYFVMGDNRNNSYDSRIIGPIKRSDIKGIIIRRK